VHVSAKDLGTGKEQKIRIESSSGLSEDEIRRMVNDAESHAAEDQQLKDAAVARNEGDQLAYSMEKALADHGEKVSEADRNSITEAISSLRGVLDSGSAEEIRGKMDALNQASQKLAEELYKSQPSEGAAGPTGFGGAAEAGDGAQGEESRATSAEDAEVEYEVVDEE
jgi:molecular chaperone DnaK